MCQSSVLKYPYYIRTNGACAGHRFNPVWPTDKPLRVWIEPSADEYRRGILAAIATWNRAIGREFLVESYDPDSWDVVVYWSGDNNGHTYAGVRHYMTEESKELKAMMSIEGYLDKYPTVDLQVLVHEFGHILGLKHDKGDKGSIMYPYLGSDGRDRKHIRANDIFVLKRLYGKAPKELQNSCQIAD